MANDKGLRLLGGSKAHGGNPEKGKAKSAGIWVNGVGRFEIRGGVAWKIRYRVPVESGSGTTRQKTETLKHCASRKQAEGVLALRNAAIFEGTYRPRTSAAILVSVAAKMFLDGTKPRDPKNVQGDELASWVHYEKAFRLHLLPFFDKRYLNTITTSDCEDYRRARLAEGAAPATARVELRYFQSMFANARKRKYTTLDPVSDVSFKKIDNARKRSPSDAECSAIAGYLLKEPPASFFRPVVFTLYCTALRIESILTLRWEHIDFEGKTVETKQKGGEWVKVHMPDLMMAELQRWRHQSDGLSNSGYVFPSSRDRDGHTTQTAVNKRWAKMLEALEIKDLVRHDFRRRMVTALLRVGADDNAILLTTKHKDIRIAHEHYDARQRSEIAPLMERVTDLKLISDRDNPAKSIDTDATKKADNTR